MPVFDGTGPNGAGPMTGRGMGPCGQRTARGWFGRRFRRQQPPADRADLEREIDDLTVRLDAVKRQLGERD